MRALHYLLAAGTLAGLPLIALSEEPFSKHVSVVSDSRPSPPLPAAKADAVKSGMTLKELVDLLGPGWLPRYSNVGFVVWYFTDGRELWLSPWGGYEAATIVTFDTGMPRKGFNHLLWHPKGWNELPGHP